MKFIDSLIDKGKMLRNRIFSTLWRLNRNFEFRAISIMESDAYKEQSRKSVLFILEYVIDLEKKMYGLSIDCPDPASRKDAASWVNCCRDIRKQIEDLVCDREPFVVPLGSPPKETE